MPSLIPGIEVKLPPAGSDADGHELISLLTKLHESKAKLNGDKRQTVKCTVLPVPGPSSAVLSSWKFDEFSYGKIDKPLPTDARGLFSYRDENTGRQSIVIRGYDKFFNTDEVPVTRWSRIEAETRGPYDLTLKQNGCIIFIGALPDRTLLVTSKHSIGSRGDVAESHSERGQAWLLRHLQSAGKTVEELAAVLSTNKLTAVCELCDDDFEEHILAYPSEKAGLYLHGLNLNTPVFSTYPIREVNIFATFFGFRSNPHITVPDLRSLRTLLDECAKSGTYQGTEVEGFVVRTQVGASDFFFKYKFEEPYLLFRQWREVTKAVIAGKEPKFRLHRAVTNEYLQFIAPIIQDPLIRKRFTENHGIIELRQRFLDHRGGDLAEIIANPQPVEAEDDLTTIDWQKDRFVIAPIATIGCGKTTIAVALKSLFGFGHVQNDNILAKKASHLFAKDIYESFEKDTTRVVIADRNNHMFHERASLVSDIKEMRKAHDPRVHFIALVFDQSSSIRNFTVERVLKRGDNHQSIRAATMSPESIKSIMDGFHQRFQALDLQKSPDDAFAHVIPVDPLQGSRINLERVAKALVDLGIVDTMPTASNLDEAFDAALVYKPTVYKQVTSHESTRTKADKKEKKRQKNGKQDEQKNEKQNKEKPKKTRQVEYFGLRIENHAGVLQLLDERLSECEMYHALRTAGRVQQEFHVTLCHAAQKKSHEQVWSTYLDMPEGRHLQVRLDDVRWNDRVMACTVTIVHADDDDGQDLPHANETLHMTVGTASAAVKPVESNAMLAASSSAVAHASLSLDGATFGARFTAYYR